MRYTLNNGLCLRSGQTGANQTPVEIRLFCCLLGSCYLSYAWKKDFRDDVKIKWNESSEIHFHTMHHTLDYLKHCSDVSWHVWKGLLSFFILKLYLKLGGTRYSSWRKRIVGLPLDFWINKNLFYLRLGFLTNIESGLAYLITA